MAGFADHDALGMFSFFTVLLVLTLSLKGIDKMQQKRDIKWIILLGLLLGFASTFTVVSWIGVSQFVFMIVPLAFFLYWLVNSKNFENENTFRKLRNFLILYSTWFMSVSLFGTVFGLHALSVIKNFMLGASGIIGPFLLVFIFVDYGLIKKREQILKNKILKYRIILSFLISLIIGVILFSIFIGNPINTLSELINKLTHPFGTGRVSLTVAENKRPYLNDFFGQVGKNIFWLFYLGMVFIGVNLAKGIRSKKNKIGFFFVWVLFISGLLFSRISPSSILNGDSFISRLFYFGSILIFAVYLIWMYINQKIHMEKEVIIIVAWLVPMLIALRGAIRLFFLIVPSICFMIGYLSLNIINYLKIKKEEVVRFFLIVGGLVILVLMIISFLGYANSISIQAKGTGPSANPQWQKAMSWVRENTGERDIFVHWWDYGYWVQYLGERPSITDGGHANGYWDHLIGRYVLTTPKPETAFSFMKAHNVSYLLIDPTDIGKYSAYSKIGSGPEGDDRFSWIPITLSNSEQIQETRNGTIRIYQGGSALDEDIIYSINDTEIFLPKGKAGIGGVIIETTKNNDSIGFIQPKGVFVYNGQQILLPLRYLEYEGQFHDFKNGIDATVKIIPRFEQSGQQVQMDGLGALIYLSPKVARGMVGQLYLMNDPLDQYQGLELVHAEVDPVVSGLKTQGANLNEFLYYRGLRGPIKIWKVDCPSNIVAREEFLRTSGDWAEFDDLDFTK
jgi:hypothetical protein